MPNAPSGVNGGRTRACDACRGLKLRCDAHKFDYGSCSRCRRLGRNCVISQTPKKRNRQTKAELESELNRLRDQVEKPASSKLATTQMELPLAPPRSSDVTSMPATGNLNMQLPWSDLSFSQSFANGETIPSGNLNTVNQNGPLSSAPGSSVPTTDWTSPRENSLYHSPSIGVSVDSNHQVRQSPLTRSASVSVTPRSIDGVNLGSHKLSDCFTRFFNHYAPNVPGIFDGDQDPDTVYQNSEYLFWTIVYVGARRSKDPTIVESLTRPLTELAQKALFNPESAISSIRAAIALCVWPLPINSTFRDLTHAMSGAAVQLAIQNGLPFTARRQDFARVPVEHLEKERLFHSRLWLYCQWTFQSNNLANGLPCAPTMQVAQARQEQTLLDGLPRLISYEYQLHQILVEAVTLIMRTVDLNSNTDSDILRPLIEHFDTTFRQVAAHDSELTTRFLLCSMRLTILSYYFFTAPDSHRDAGLVTLHAVACDLIDLAVQMDKKNDFVLYCTNLQARMVQLAAFSILRIHRSHLLGIVNGQQGEEMFFESIRISKKRSVQHDDLEIRGAVILTQLWSSAKLFKFKDGTIDGLQLLLRGRLHMSVIFDALWWWRSEFGGTSNPYVQPETSQNAIPPASEPSTVVTAPIMNQTLGAFSNNMIDFEQVPDWLMDCSGVPDWQWNANFNWNPTPYT